MGRSVLLLMLVGANVLWGSSWVVAKLVLHELSPLQISAWRMIGTAPVAALWLALALRRNPLPRGAWPTLLVLGFMSFVASKFLNLWGLTLTTATHASLLTAVEPLFTIALGCLLLAEAFTKRRAGAFLCGAVGAWLLVTEGGGWTGAGAASGPALGDLIFMAGLALEAGYSVIGKSLLTRHAPAVVTMATVLASLVFWAPLAGWDGLRNGWPAWSPAVLAGLAFLSLGCTVLAYWIWFLALREMEAGLAALTIFVQPVWGSLLAVWLLDEPLLGSTLVGGALVLVSLYLATAPPLRGKRRA